MHADPADGLSGPRILVVDDAETHRRVVSEILTDAGFRVLQARDGIEGVALALRVTDGPLWVRGEVPRLARLAADLLAAVANGMAPGSEVVLATARDGTAPVAPGATLTVRARGRVLEPLALERIFEPFVADRGHEGGLRLPTVYAVVTESGGTVAAESSPAEGTTIRVGLLLAEPPAGGKGSAP